jgi:hypothetical protein
MRTSGREGRKDYAKRAKETQTKIWIIPFASFADPSRPSRPDVLYPPLRIMSKNSTLLFVAFMLFSTISMASISSMLYMN